LGQKEKKEKRVKKMVIPKGKNMGDYSEFRNKVCPDFFFWYDIAPEGKNHKMVLLRRDIWTIVPNLEKRCSMTLKD